MAAPTINALVIADPPEAWVGAGFTVDGETCVVGQVRLHLVGRDGDRKRILSWSLRGVPEGTESIDGLATTTSDEPMPSPVTHANGAELIDHLVVMSPDVDRTIAALERHRARHPRVRGTWTLSNTASRLARRSSAWAK